MRNGDGKLLATTSFTDDTGVPTGTISATYDPGTGALSASGQYSWDACNAKNKTKWVGFALFIDGPDAGAVPGNPTEDPQRPRP